MNPTWLNRDAAEARVAGVALPDTALGYNPGDGRYYFKGEPFTGVTTTRWSGGELESVVHYRDGLTHGVSVGWYPDGKPMVYTEMEYETAHGWHIEWAEDGTKTVEVRYEHGVEVETGDD
jgi:antitoxin component YwqK of YwqJK toxin-antitoxin module